MVILRHCSFDFFIYAYKFFILRSLSTSSTITNLHIFLSISYSLLFFLFLGPVCISSGSTAAFKAYCAYFLAVSSWWMVVLLL
jgi:hypothetical protein